MVTASYYFINLAFPKNGRSGLSIQRSDLDPKYHLLSFTFFFIAILVNNFLLLFFYFISLLPVQLSFYLLLSLSLSLFPFLFPLFPSPFFSILLILPSFLFLPHNFLFLYLFYLYFSDFSTFFFFLMLFFPFSPSFVHTSSAQFMFTLLFFV